MKFVSVRPYADPDVAARKLIELAKKKGAGRHRVSALADAQIFRRGFAVASGEKFVAHAHPLCTNTSGPSSSGLMKPKPLVGLNHFTIPIATTTSPYALQANGRFLRCHAFVRNPIRDIPLHPLAFDPAFLEQALHRSGIFRKLDSLDPAATTKPLHELTFAMVGDKGYFWPLSSLRVEFKNAEIETPAT